MFFVKASDGRYYTGRAGEGWLGPRSEAFMYKNRSAAEYKAAQFSKFSTVHGLTFKALMALGWGR